MRILHIAETARGGVGSYLAELLPHQVREFGAGNVGIVAPLEHIEQLGSLEDMRVTTFRRPGRSIRALVGLLRAANAAITEFRPDIVHLHSTFAGMLLRLSHGWRRWRPAIVYCPHGWSFDMDMPWWRRRTAMLLERALARLCDRVIAVSRHEARQARVLGVPSQRIELVLNGIGDTPDQAPLPWSQDRLRVLFIGRLDRQKGYDVLSDAFAPLARKVSIRVVGEAVAGPAEAYGASPDIEQLGWLPRDVIAGHLAAADLLVVPSRWEAFGLVALEAMRAGRPVIASDVGGLREVVSHGATGLLVTPDRPADLAASIAALTPDRRQRMGQAGRRRFLAHFTSLRMHRQLLDVYYRCAPGVPLPACRTGV